MKLQQVKHIVIIGIVVVVVPFIILVVFRKKIFALFLAPEQRKYIAQLHKKAQFKFEKFIERVEKETDYNVIITDGYRTFADQEKEHEIDPNNPPAGEGLHGYGLAIDINATNGTSYLRKSSSKIDWENTGIPQIARDMGLRWGGDFKNYYDPVHFDLGNDYDASHLKELAFAQFGTNWDDIMGNEVKII